MDLFVGKSLTTGLGSPALTPGSEADLWVPRHQFDASLGARFHRYFGARVGYRHGLSANAARATAFSLGQPEKDVIGAGIMLDARYPADEELELHVSLGAMLFGIPSAAVITCKSECSASSNFTGTEYSFMSMNFGNLSLNWQLLPTLRLWGGVAIQNHPTNKSSFESDSPDTNTKPGPVNPIVNAGIEITANEHLSLTYQFALPVVAAPVRYYPIATIGLRGTLGSILRRRPE